MKLGSASLQMLKLITLLCGSIPSPFWSAGNQALYILVKESIQLESKPLGISLSVMPSLCLMNELTNLMR